MPPDTAQELQIMFTSTIMGKKCDLSDFDLEMIAGARQADLSTSETADLLEFSHTTVSIICKELCDKQETSSEWVKVGKSTLLMREGTGKGTVWSLQHGMHTTFQTSKWIGYSSRPICLKKKK